MKLRSSGWSFKLFGVLLFSSSLNHLAHASPPFVPIADPNLAEGACEMVSAQVMQNLIDDGFTPVSHQVSNLGCGIGQHIVVFNPATNHLYDYTFSQMLSRIDFTKLSPEAKKIYLELLEKGHSAITEANFKHLMELYKNTDPNINFNTLLKPTVDLIGPNGAFPPEEMARLLNKELGPNADRPQLRDPDVPRYKMININGRMALVLVDRLGKVLDILEWITDPAEALEETAVDFALTNPYCLVGGAAVYCAVAPHIATQYTEQIVNHYLQQTEVYQNMVETMNQEIPHSAPLGEANAQIVQELFSKPLHEITEEEIQFMISTGDPIFSDLLARLGVGQ